MRRFAIFLLIALSLLAKEAFKPGVSRWVIKTSLVEGIDLKKSKKVDVTDLYRLKDPPGEDKRFNGGSSFTRK